MPMQQRNSMANAMTVLVTAAMWIAGALGLIGLPILSIGLAASLSDGPFNLAGIEALAEDVEPGQLALGIAGLLIIVPGLIFICLQVRRILLTLADGDPFVPENAGRLSRIGVAIAAMEMIRLATIIVLRGMPGIAGDVPPKLSTQLILWISVAALFILSQVFREGTRLRNEEKMTI